MRMRRPSIKLPIAVASVAVALAIALLVGWTIIIVQTWELSRRFAENGWLLPTGIVAFALIMATLVSGVVYLVRQILETRRQDRFIDSVTHELKSPLASLQLGLETMGRDKLATTQREELRTMMLDDVARLRSFIDGVLEASRLAIDREGHDLADVPLRELVQTCCSRVQRRRRAEGARITIEIDEGLVLRTDRTALETVFHNLIDNAVKYSNAPAEIAIRTFRDDDELRIEVADHGIGVARNHLGRIFERFHRVPDERVYARGGTGLGLYVVSALVDQLGGRIRATSDGIDHGTTLTVTLPRSLIGRGT